ncbi:MAG TPA: PxKF domain-containing protein [Actinomycetota bacterium]|nr:PxKF domain-containing protein [Actinomycetota bacterium]
MSFLRVQDTPGGLAVDFADYRSGLNEEGCTTGSNFAVTTIATGLDRSVPHSLGLSMDFVDGVANDVVEVYVDDALVHTGTSWEDYFRECEGNPTRTVDSLLFQARSSGGTAPDTLGDGFLIDNVHTTTSPVPTTTTIVVDPANMNGWAFFNESGASGSGGFQPGPGTAPVGDGSVRLTVGDAASGHGIGVAGYGGTRLDDITRLEYRTYRSSFDAGNNLAIAFQFPVDADLTDGNTGWQGRLVFEPYQGAGGAVLEDTWQHWDMLTGKWWATGAPVNGACPQAAPCSWAALLAQFPDAGVHPAFGGILLKAGSGWASFEGNVDRLTLGVDGTETVFDFEPEEQCTTTCFVNGTTGDDAFGGTTSGTAKKTIQAAVNQVDVGGTVVVAAGTYAEHVTLDKAVTLQGANLGVAGNDSRGTESVISGSSSGALQITADDVTIDGFRISSPSNNLGAGVHMSSATSGALITNNLITGNQIGVYANSDGPSTISHNLFTANNEQGAAGGSGIYSEFTNGLTISDNEFSDHGTNTPIIFGATAAGAHQDLMVSGNEIHDNVSGIFVLGVNGGDFVDNDISAGAGTALSFGGGGNTDILVTGNLVHDSARGVRVQEFGFLSGGNSDIRVNRNAITDNSDYGVGNISGFTGTLDATCNWWGQATGPASADVTGAVDPVPWLTTSDLDGDCFGGSWTFQGFFSPVDNDDPNTIKAGRSVPLKWRILDEDGVPIDDPSSFNSLTSVACDDPLDVIDESGATNTGLASMGDGNWQFNWATDPDYEGSCRTLVLTLGDGSFHTATFHLK